MLHAFNEQQERARQRALAEAAVEKLISPVHFLAAIKQHHFTTVNQFFIKYAASSESHIIQRLINLDPNKLMQNMTRYSDDVDLRNKDYFEVLKVILTHINKQKIYPYLLWETQLAIDKIYGNLSKPKEREKFKAQTPIRTLLLDIYAKLKSFLGEDCCKQVAQYKIKKEILRKMR